MIQKQMSKNSRMHDRKAPNLNSSISLLSYSSFTDKNIISMNIGIWCSVRISTQYNGTTSSVKFCIFSKHMKNATRPSCKNSNATPIKRSMKKLSMLYDETTTMYKMNVKRCTGANKTILYSR